MKKSSAQKPVKTTRLFSLQLANHDALFAPRVKSIVSYRWLKLLVLYFPALAFLMLPSFKLGRGFIKSPPYSIPDSIQHGELFTLPTNEDDDFVPQINGRTMGFIDGKSQFYLGAAPGQSDFNVTVHHLEEKPRYKALVEKLRHPSYPLFVKRVHVKPAPEPELPKPAPAARGKSEELPKKPPGIDAKETRALERVDGNVRIRCWREPVVEPIGVDPLKPRRHQRLGSLAAAGQGEVVFAGSIAQGESTVLLYHGGGLFTRYYGLKELRVQKGSRVVTGQIVGHVPLNTAKNQPTKATWQPLMNVTGRLGPLNPQSLLALSSQLCDSK